MVIISFLLNIVYIIYIYVIKSISFICFTNRIIYFCCKIIYFKKSSLSSISIQFRNRNAIRRLRQGITTLAKKRKKTTNNIHRVMVHSKWL